MMNDDFYIESNEKDE